MVDDGQIGVSPELPYASKNGVSVRVVLTEVEAPESLFLYGLRGPCDAQWLPDGGKPTNEHFL